jgi:hypothetical protein
MDSMHPKDKRKPKGNLRLFYLSDRLHSNILRGQAGFQSDWAASGWQLWAAIFGTIL